MFSQLGTYLLLAKLKQCFENSNAIVDSLAFRIKWNEYFLDRDPELFRHILNFWLTRKFLFKT